MASKALISTASATSLVSSPKLAGLVPSARNASLSFSSPASKVPSSSSSSSSRLSMVVKAQQQPGAGHLVGPHPQPAAPVHAAWNSTEEERWFKVRIDVPGVGAEDIDVKIEGEMLVIKDLGRQIYSPYDTKVQLPPYCIKQQTTATLDKGVLHVSVPKMLVTTTAAAIPTQPILVHVPTVVHVPAPTTSPVIHVPVKRPITQAHTQTHA